MPELSELSPYVRQVLDDNHLEPKRLLRYGPRYVCLVVTSGEVEGFFKMVLPIEERVKVSPPGYRWTHFDEPEVLEQRLLKESLFLQFFSQQIGEAGALPQIIALSDTSPVWSLRTFIHERTMSAWNSDFVFSPRFFRQITPHQAVEFFARLHEMSEILPHNLVEMVQDFRSTLVNTSRFERTAERAREMPAYRGLADALEARFYEYLPQYEDYRPVIAHYEPYPPHIYNIDGHMGLIDWENVGWAHPLQDLSVLYMRCLAEPDWQAKYMREMNQAGYFQGQGQLFWESELLIQAFANHRYFAEGGPIGTPEFDKKAMAFFTQTIDDVLENGQFFRLAQAAV